MPIESYVRILIAAVAVLAFAADAKHVRGKQVGAQGLDANGNLAERHRPEYVPPHSGHMRIDGRTSLIFIEATSPFRDQDAP